MLKTEVIASSITNLTDARYFAAWEVFALGFDLNANSEHFVSPQSLNAIREWVSGPKILGEFSGMQDKEEIDLNISTLDLDIVQLGPFAPSEWSFNIPVIREIVLDEPGEPKPADYYILKYSGKISDITSKLISISQTVKNTPAFLDFNFEADSLLQVIENWNAKGIVLRGGEEEKVGFKSYDEIDSIIEMLEID